MTPELHTISRYHEVDLRENYYELKKFKPDNLKQIKTNMKAVACLMTIRDIHAIEYQNKVIGYKLSDKVMTLEKIIRRYIIRNSENEDLRDSKISDEEKFLKELAPGFATGFLVSDCEIMTAGHCMCVKDETRPNTLKNIDKINNMRVVFGYYHSDENNQKTFFDVNQVFSIKEVVKYNFDPSDKMAPDYALVQLDRTVKNIKPLKIDFSPVLGNSVYSLGCPMGLAVKCSGLGYAVIKNINSIHIHENTDVMNACSGSPLIDVLSNKVIGIAVLAHKAYHFDKKHFEKTKEKRFSSFVITKEIIQLASSPYNKCQRLSLDMFNFYRFVRFHGQDLTQKISRERSIIFLKEKEKEFNDIKLEIKNGIIMIATVFGLIHGSIDTALSHSKLKKLKNDMSQYEKVSRENRLNYLESKNLIEIKNQNLSQDKKIKIAQHMSAYKIDEEHAIFLLDHIYK